ncbi:MAG: carbohydrate kinase family protein [Deltaproteobacteria bacterium]|nr:MAG: carbohydrate kinase family protein [Deltaproteobacteria bacterium]
MPILVTGSLAIDHVMVFPDHFKNHILPEKVHLLDVAFNVPELTTSFGGTAGNIAYHLRLLGEDPIILATAGHDFAPYAAWLDRSGIRRDGILELADAATAQGFAITDLSHNQIFAFHEGAMARAHEARLDSVSDEYEVGIVSSNGKQAMIDCARGLKARGVRAVVDPSHGLPLFDRDELVEMIEGSFIYIVNDYELALTTKKLGISERELAARVEALVVTKGEQGSIVIEDGHPIEIPPVRANPVVDPTGCGDAYRAGLLAGLSRGLTFETAGRMGSLLGSLKIGHRGAQGLQLDLEGFRARYAREFGAAF